MDLQDREYDDYRPDEVSIKPLISTFWQYRRAIGLVVAATTVLFLLIVLVLFIRTPVERMATLGFRPTFDGADSGKYPNGTLFSSADIISTPVLSEVFAANDLQRFGSFQDFKNSVFVVQSNPEIDVLSYEYQTKLSDTKLNPVDRVRIEEEFRKKRESLPVGYSLNLRRTERATRMPSELTGKILHDILATWARLAAERKGVLKYNIPVLSKNIVSPASFQTEDYIVIADIIRSKIHRTLQNIDELAKIPGAAVARTSKDQISLAEIRANLEDVSRFKVQPLIGMIRSTGLTRDRALAILYLENQLLQSRLESDEAAGRVRTLQNSLSQYMQEGRQVMAPGPGQAEKGGGTSAAAGGVQAMIPQFGESFLDRLTQMANQNTDVRFRQDLTERVIEEGVKAVGLEKDTAYYTDLIAALKTGGVRRPSAEMPGDQASTAELVKARAAEALSDLVRSLDQINEIYTEISAHNLNPSTLLYTVTRPFTLTTTHALSLRTMAMAGLLVLVLTSLLASAAALAHAYIRKEIVRAPAAAAAGEPASTASKEPATVA